MSNISKLIQSIHRRTKATNFCSNFMGYSPCSRKQQPQPNITYKLYPACPTPWAIKPFDYFNPPTILSKHSWHNDIMAWKRFPYYWSFMGLIHAVVQTVDIPPRTSLVNFSLCTFHYIYIHIYTDLCVYVYEPICIYIYSYIHIYWYITTKSTNDHTKGGQHRGCFGYKYL